MKSRKLKLVTSALALAMTSLIAAAATVGTSQTISTTIGAEWYTWSGLGLTIGDASFDGHGDAFDDGWYVRVNGAYYNPETVDLTGTTMTGPVIGMSGLNVSTQYYFAPNSAVARILVTLHNPGSVPVAATVDVPTNYGSDGGTVYRATSSGDTAITTADRWIISSDGAFSDPINTSVFYGPGTVREAPTAYYTTVHSAAGSEGIGAAFALDVPAGGTQSLMFFAGLNGITTATNTLEAAQAGAVAFNSNTTLLPEWLNGMSNAQKSQVVNWALDTFTTCAAEGLYGAKLTLCRQICELPQSPSTLSSLIKVYLAAFRENPPCAR